MKSDERKVLHLTLHRKWFNEILSGRKKKEFRKAKLYWNRRLGDRVYDEIRFVNGYGKNRPFMRVECKGIYADRFTYNWVIVLGKILEVGNV